MRRLPQKLAAINFQTSQRFVNNLLTNGPKIACVAFGGISGGSKGRSVNRAAPGCLEIDFMGLVPGICVDAGGQGDHSAEKPASKRR